MRKEISLGSVSTAIEPVNPEQRQSRDISLKGIFAIYTGVGLAVSAALIASNQLDKAAYVLGWTGLSAIGLGIKE